MTNETVIINTPLEDYSKENFWKKNGEIFFNSVMMAFFIVFVCTLFDKNFFFYDDAQNEILGFLKAYGKVWLKGEIPFIVKDTFVGTSTMVRMQSGIFLPYNIIFSIISTQIKSLVLLSKLNAFFNLVLISFFSQKIAEVLEINKKFRIIMGFLFCINPIFLYIYLGTWWNNAIGQVCFVFAMLSIFLLRKNFSNKNLLINIIAVLCLIASGHPHAMLPYVFMVFFLLLEYFLERDYKKIFIFLSVSFGTFLIGLNIVSEYIVSSKMTLTDSGFGNFGNFWSLSYNQLLMTFSPVYFSFISNFSGYNAPFISMGYSSIYVLFVIVFNDNFLNIFKNKNMKFITYLLISFFVLTQTPTAFGPFRWPFRFGPFFSEIMIIFSLYGISLSNLKFNKSRISVFIGILLISLLISIFEIEREFGKIFQVNILFVTLTIFYLYTVIKEKEFKLLPSIIYSLFILFFMLFSQKSLEGLFTFPNLQKEVTVDNILKKNGYTLSLTNGGENKKNIENLNSAQFMLFDIKAINGASSVLNTKLAKLLETTASQAYFHGDNLDNTINNLSSKYENVCYFDLMNITNIIEFEERLSEDMKNKIFSCGYEMYKKEPNVLFFMKDKDIIGNVSYIPEDIKINRLIQEKNNFEKYSISSINENYIVFSKVYWPGYRAYINGKRIHLTDEKGLIKVLIPKKLNNAILEIRYFPKSWRITLWLALIGFIGIISVLIYMKKDKKFNKGE